MSDGYQTLNEAVYYAALATREAYGDKAESISVVYEQEGRFHFTPPTSEKQTNHNVSARVKIPKGSQRFIVHNHPAGKRNDQFSEDDIANAERLKVPSAIIFGADPTIRIYTPGDTRTEQERSSRPRREWPRYSVGDEFAGMMQ